MDQITRHCGLEVLVEVEDPEVDIIAVQGLGSDPKKSWVWKAHSDEEKRAVKAGLQKEKVNWLEDLLPKDLSKARVLAFNYESRWWNKDAASQRTDNCARLMLRALHDPSQQGRSGCRPTIFVGHSFGGVVIQRVIVEAVENREFRYLLDWIVGIVFLGTPNRGTDSTGLARYIAHVGKKIGMGSHDTILQDLKKDSDILFELRNRFVQWLNKSTVQINCVFEGRKTSVGFRDEMIVPESSAGLDGYPPDRMDADHHTINKFWGIQDPSYQLVIGYLRRLVVDMPKILKYRFQPLKIVQDTRDIKDKDQLACLEAMFLTDPSADLERVQQAKGGRTYGTCTWLVSTIEYVSWLSGDCPQVLHVTGNAGIGKTMMSTFLVQEILEKAQTTEITFAYYFCDNKDERRNTTSCVIRGLLLQLLRQRTYLFRHIINEFAYKKEKLFEDFYDMWRILSVILRDETIGNVYLLIDALDECSPASCKDLLASLEILIQKLRSQKSSKLRLLITSRPETRILDNITPDYLLRMDSSKINTDLSLYIKTKIEELPKIRKYPRLKEEVRTALEEKSGGTFLWVSLVTQDLEKALPSQVQHKLKVLPKTLDDVYERIISEIDPDLFEKAELILKLLVAAHRPLTKIELATAILSHSSSSDALPLAEDVEIVADDYTCCGALLFVGPPLAADNDGTIGETHNSLASDVKDDTGSGSKTIFTLPSSDGKEHHATINLVHQSVKDYLSDEKRTANGGAALSAFPPDQINCLMFEACWNYLSAKEFDCGNQFYKLTEDNKLTKVIESVEDLPNSERRNSWEYHFVDYAVNELLQHASKSLPYLMSQSVWTRFNFKIVPALRDMMMIFMTKNMDSTIILLLLNQGARIEAKNSFGQTALICAAWAGSESTTQLLLDRGANIEAKDDDGETALIRAAWAGSKSTIQLLLDRGANIEAKDDDRQTALICAARAGSESTIQLLLDRGANIEAKDNIGRTALIRAAWAGSELNVQLLLDRGAFIEKIDYYCKRTALVFAVKCGCLSVIRTLLAASAKITMRDFKGRSPLDYAIRKLAKARLRKGKPGRNWGARNDKYESDRKEIVRLLSEAQKEINAETEAEIIYFYPGEDLWQVDSAL